MKSRDRECTDPLPSNGGLDCVGDPTETVQCNLVPCPGMSECLLLKHMTESLEEPRELITNTL